MKRNDFLKTLGFSAAGLWMAEGVLSSCMDHSMEASQAPTVKEGDFTRAFPIPKTAVSVTALTARTQTHAVLSGKPGNVLGYDQGILGPTFRVQRGATVTVPFTNGLTEDTNIHWHGLLVPSAMDGHPDQQVKAGKSFTYTFTLNQPAGMAWYHPHPHMQTGKQVFMGLAGLFIIESPEESALGLPAGEYELPLIIQDKRLNKNGGLVYDPSMGDIMAGYMGDTIAVNGVNAPFHEVATRMYRVRILNGSNGRIYNLALSNGNSFQVIGSDGGLSPAPETVTSVLLAPGERLDLLIDFGKVTLGTEVFLQSNLFNGVTSQGKQTFKLVKFKVSKSEVDLFKMPVSFPQLPSLAVASKTRNIVIGSEMHSSGGHSRRGSRMGMHTINDKTYEDNRIDESVALNATEIWEFDNSKGDEPHPMHLHGTFFQIQSRSGGRGALFAHEKGRKDTVLVMPGEIVRVVVHFERPGKFVFHCHNLEHEDDGMMLNFEVK